MMTRRRKGSGSEDNNHGMHQDQSISSGSHATSSQNLRNQEEQQDVDFTELERREMQDNRRSSEENTSHLDGETSRTRNRTSLTQSSPQRQTSQGSTCLSPGCNSSPEVGVNFNNTSTSSSLRVMPVSVSSSSTTGNMFTSRRTSSTQNEISSIQNNSSSLPSPTTSSRQELTSTEQLTGSDARRALNGVWSTRGASFFACFLCCVNFYTLSRFAVLAYFFKGMLLKMLHVLKNICGMF